MFNFLDVLKTKTPLLLVVLGAFAIFYGVYDVHDLAKLDFAPRPQAAWLQTACGLFMVLVGIYTNARLYPRVRSIPKLAGKWIYHVYNSDNSLSHSGTCEIQQQAERIIFSGIRRYFCIYTATESYSIPVNIAWESHWGSYCYDDYIRFEYHIEVPDADGMRGQTVKGICRARLKDGNNSFQGTYYMLLPFAAQANNAPYGRIEFNRPPKGKSEPEPPANLRVR